MKRIRRQIRLIFVAGLILDWRFVDWDS